MQLDSAEAQGRVIAAGRMMAGMDQAELAAAADVSPSTISNVERGRIVARPPTMKAIKRALRKKGVTLTYDPVNCHIAVATSYEADE